MRLHLLAALLALAACSPIQVVPDAERARAISALTGQQRTLRVAVTVHALFGDRGRRLLLDAPAAEVDLLRSGGGGEVIAPPAAEAVLLPGTPARIERVEFPTALTIARRVVMTPRYHPWVYLSVGGDPRPAVLVLSYDSTTAADLIAEVDRVLTTDDPSSMLAALAPEQRAAIGRKELVEGMGPRAVEMAWGLPEIRRLDRPTGTEDWSWPGGKRRAFFADDRLVRWDR
jgi:hypothetical protein